LLQQSGSGPNAGALGNLGLGEFIKLLQLCCTKLLIWMRTYFIRHLTHVQSNFLWHTSTCFKRYPLSWYCYARMSCRG